MRTIVIVAPDRRAINNEMYRMAQDLPLAEAKYQQSALIAGDVTYRFFTPREVIDGKVRGMEISSVIWYAQHLMDVREWMQAKEELAWRVRA